MCTRVNRLRNDFGSPFRPPPYRANHVNAQAVLPNIAMKMTIICLSS